LIGLYSMSLRVFNMAGSVTRNRGRRITKRMQRMPKSVTLFCLRKNSAAFAGR
jgi:hypothetical protein